LLLREEELLLLSEVVELVFFLVQAVGQALHLVSCVLDVLFRCLVLLQLAQFPLCCLQILSHVIHHCLLVFYLTVDGKNGG